ncbi:hypothetical protein [Streptomyces xantholiticus]|uniref:Uncharacterized protein n=1 Tax=Streptomyces xantholiticus TaxID=68285 RepID=A0ABV1UR40_9ACTN
MSDARAAAGPQNATMPAPLRRAGGDGGPTQASALGENGEML